MLTKVFWVVMYGCESWTIKKAEPRTIDAFELWCWRRLLRDPWTARRSNQSTLKEISPVCPFLGLMLKLKLKYFGHPMRRADSFEKTCWERLREGGEGDDRGWDGWMASLTQWTWVWVNSGSWWWTERPGLLQSTGSQRVRHDWATEVNWTHQCTLLSYELKKKISLFLILAQIYILELLRKGYSFIHSENILWASITGWGLDTRLPLARQSQGETGDRA